jgi:hypothetical protein
MAAPPPSPRQILPADVQGGPLARLLISHPDVAAAVFAYFTYADVTPLRLACRGFRGAVGEHPWAFPLPVLLLVPGYWDVSENPSAVRTPAGLARWRASFPAARTLMLAPTRKINQQLRDADVAPVAAWGLTGVHIAGVLTLTRAGLAALCTPTLTALGLWNMWRLSAADVGALTAPLPRLRTLHLNYIGALAAADLAAWGGVHDLALLSIDVGGFTWAGVRHLSAVRELSLPLLPFDVNNWAGDVFRGLTRLTSLSLQSMGGPATASGPAGLFAPGSLPHALRHVRLHDLTLAWPPGVVPDGGAVLLRPLAGVPLVSLSSCNGVGDAGLAALVGATSLWMLDCHDVTGEHLEPLGGALQWLTVWRCKNFSGVGLGSLAALRQLRVVDCVALRADALTSIAACAALERIHVSWEGRLGVPALNIAAAEAALRASASGGAWGFTSGPGYMHHYAGYWAATRHQ